MKRAQTDQVKPRDKRSVLLVADLVNNSAELIQALAALNYCISAQISSRCKLTEKCAQYLPDILIISAHSPSPDTLKELARLDQLAPLPVLIFAMQDSLPLIQAAIKAGVSAYVVNEIQPHRLNSLITVACERFKERQLLRDELQQTKTQLVDRKLIERAKGFIMQQKGMNEQDAFNLLRKMAMNNGHSLATVSKNVIEVYQLLTPTAV